MEFGDARGKMDAYAVAVREYLDGFLVAMGEGKRSGTSHEGLVRILVLVRLCALSPVCGGCSRRGAVDKSHQRWTEEKVLRERTNRGNTSI